MQIKQLKEDNQDNQNKLIMYFTAKNVETQLVLLMTVLSLILIHAQLKLVTN